jgi:AcrR family transcriptional regulator
MPRPNQSVERRKQLIPEVARVFSRYGYRRTTTAQLAHSCGVRENILYRLWPDKKAMFIAAIDYIYEISVEIWEQLLASKDQAASPARMLLDYESEHHGELGFYRIVFAGLSESDDPEIRAALRRMYQRFQRFISRQIEAHRQAGGRPGIPEPQIAAWAFIGVGTMANIGREFDLLSTTQRENCVRQVGKLLLGD